MTRYLQFAARHPYLVAALIVVLFLPWLWMAVELLSAAGVRRYPT